MNSYLVLGMVVLLSLLAGFSTQRGSLCAVAAAKDVIHKQRWSRFNGFLQCAAWSMLLLVAAQFAGLAQSLPAAGSHSILSSPPWLMPLLGGALFGIGAWINGGCSFGSVARLGSGELSFSLTLLAMVGGYLAFNTLGMQAGTVGAPQWDRYNWIIQGLLAAILVLNLRELFRLRAWRLAAWRRQTWPVAMAVWLFALSNIALLLLAGQWPGVTAPADALHGEMVGPLRWLILPLFIGGAVAGAITAGRFTLVAITRRALLRRLAGGFAMGFAAALVPGGNDKMLLVDIPSAHWGGILAYLGMITALFVAVGLSRRVSSV